MSVPIEVVVKGDEKVIGYACPVCHMFCSPLIYACRWDLATEAAFDHATTCCDRRCEDCGEQVEKKSYYVVCPPCLGKREAAKEAKRFADATKIPETAHDGWVYDAAREEYYASVEEWRDGAGSDDEEPAYLWATTTVDGFSLDADDIIQSALDNGDHHEDAIESVDAIGDLQASLDAWCAKQDVKSYMVDYTRAVVLSAKPEGGAP